jgi:hypothetical protein
MTVEILDSENDGVSVYYCSLGSDFGFYRSTPDSMAYICLDQSLKNGTDSQHLAVYHTLLNFHKSLDTWDRLIPIVKYFKALVPPEGIPMPEPELEFVGRAIRVWRFTAKEDTHIIGTKAG